MSKSEENPKGVIRLLDPLDVVRKKIMGATTDSLMSIKYDPENQPGISNLINIYSAMTNKNYSEIEDEFKDSNYGTFKKAVADSVVSTLEVIQKDYNTYLNSSELDDILDSGREFSRKIAKEKFEDMKEKMGFSRK